MRRARVIAMAAAGMLMASCSGLNVGGVDVSGLVNTASSLATASQGISEPQEIELGKQWAATLTGAAPLVSDVGLESYVNHVGVWIAQQSERPNLPWHFGVLADDDINAFAAPGGYVFITRGLLVHMKNEAELAGVLGHEISHVVCKHQLKAIERQQGIGSLANLVTEQVGQKNGAVAGMVSDKLLAGFKSVLENGLDRSDELQADRMGVVLAARAGYDPYGLPSVLEMLQGLNPQDAALSLLMQTHPAPAVRLDALDRAMGTNFESFATQVENAQRYRANVGLNEKPVPHRHHRTT